MTPQSYDDDSMFGSMAGTPAPEKKQVKKRKSWGQQLPEPKTNLPPRYKLDNNFTIVDQSANPLIRKRAKTEDEKEQRRVERVLRNRRAAQSSRERKRQEVEALEAKMNEKERVNQDMERRYRDMEMQLANANAKNLALQQQLELATGGTMAVFRGSVASSPAHTEQFRRAPSPVTFSQELFGSRDAPERSSFSTQATDAPSPFDSPQTVNPASLSPKMGPVDDASNASSSLLTQHPAAMLWTTDLPCQSEEQRPWMASQTVLAQILLISNLVSLALTVSSTLLCPLKMILTSMRTKSTLSPTSSVLASIIWLTTTPSHLTSTSPTLSTTTTTNSRPMYSLRMQLLNQLLACSPNLARPLMDATIGAMRLASEQQLVRNCVNGVGSSDRQDIGGKSPSIESLMTLLWATKVFEMKRQKGLELDVATEVTWLCDELEGSLFSKSAKKHSRRISISAGGIGHGNGRTKSLEGWRRMA